MIEESINELIRNSVNLITGVSGFSIRSQPNAPRPPGNYCDVKLMASEVVGWHDVTSADNGLDVVETSSEYRRMIYSLGFYRQGALDFANDVRLGFSRNSISSLFRVGGVGVVGRSDVRNVSSLRDSSIEEMAQFDLTVSAVGTSADIVSSILTIDVAGEYQARGMVYNFNVEV